jgi:ADP-ribose pyrophosphatase
MIAPRRVASRVVFRGRVFHVERDRVRLPAGRVVIQDVVRHRRSVVLIPQPTRRHVILIRQYRHAIGGWIWELPAGSLDPREPPARAARRECEEEIGLTPRRLERLAACYPTPGFCDELMIFYRCTDLARPRGPVAGDADEIIEPRVFTVAAARRFIAKQRAQDMKTVVGLMLI